SGPQEPPRPLPWPSFAQLAYTMIPGWVLMLVATGLRSAKFLPHVVQRTWLAGAAWLLIGAWILSREQRAAQPARSSRSAWVWGVLIVAAGAGLRLWQIGHVPRYVHCDEGTVSLIALDFFTRPEFDWFSFVPSLSPLPCYTLAGIGTYLFGFNLTA